MIDHYEGNTKWNNEVTGNSSYRINEKDYAEIGRENLISQAKMLEEQGLLKIKWVTRNYDIEQVKYPLSNMDKFCELAEREPKYITILKQLRFARELYDRITTSWIRKYINEEVIARLEKGKVNEDNDKTALQYKCLESLDQLDAPVFKRVFSNHYLGGSKVFEKELQGFIIRIAKKYKDDLDEAMEDSDVLEQLSIEEYAQELCIKGSLRIEIDSVEVDTKDYRYGFVLNTQTLKTAVVLDNPQIKKIITIENKANFVAEVYEEGALILLSHGFFTPVEKVFLQNLHSKIQGQEVLYLHSGDMDYGGVRIFQYIKRNIFPELIPYRMDVRTFQKFIDYSEPITESCLTKLREIHEPLLQDTIDMIVRTGRVLEQESYL